MTDHYSHIIDSRFYRDGYSTEETRQIFGDMRRMQRWLDVELCLTNCQAELGIIPKKAAKALALTASLEKFDIQRIQDDIAKTGHSLIPLLNEWQRISGEDGQYIHYGATTQDIQDTAQSLEIQEAIDLLERDIAELISLLADKSKQYRDVICVGRTHGQQALPTTLGLKISTWLDETMRNQQRLQQCKQRVLVSQLFGGVGTMSALSAQAQTLLENFSAALGLTAPDSSWHSARDRTAELISVLALISGGLARSANEICQLAKNEIGELAEPFTAGQIGSSTMPHKRNPELCEQVVVLSKLIKANAMSGFDTLCGEHERDYRTVRLEWVALTEAITFCCAALKFQKKIIKNLVVNEAQIKNNLNQAAIFISTEALMFLLGEKIGKQCAHELIYKASQLCSSSGKELIDILLKDELIRGNFSRSDLEQAILLENHVGQSAQLIDRLTQKARQL
nr:adenylosuccinate lyase [Desulfobulbaceae bacterium]